MTIRTRGSSPIRCACSIASCRPTAAGLLSWPLRSARKTLRKKPVYLHGFGERSNPSYGPRAGSDALVMGVKDAGKVAMEMAGVKHSEINFLELYDDYIIVVYCKSRISAFAPRAI